VNNSKVDLHRTYNSVSTGHQSDTQSWRELLCRHTGVATGSPRLRRFALLRWRTGFIKNAVNLALQLGQPVVLYSLDVRSECHPDSLTNVRTPILSGNSSTSGSGTVYWQVCRNRRQFVQCGFSPGHLVFFLLPASQHYQLREGPDLKVTDSFRKLGKHV
jgi:hypothetical protein